MRAVTDDGSADSDASSEHAEEAAPRRKKKKSPARPLPHFSDGYPDDPALAALVASFRRGDYRTVRDGAPKLAASTDDAAVKTAALDLRARLEPEPLVLWMMAGTGLLLAFLVAWFYGHQH